jgi:hypothetical protein
MATADRPELNGGRVSTVDISPDRPAVAWSRWFGAIESPALRRLALTVAVPVLLTAGVLRRIVGGAGE